MKLYAAILLLAPLAHAQLYVKDQQFRFEQDDPRCGVNGFCDSEVHRSGDNHDFSLNFVEFKGNGQRWDPQQLYNAMRQVDDARQGGQKPLLFLYINGWHNNADELDNPANTNCADLKGDVAKFRDCGLTEIAKHYPTVKGAPPSVAGVYFAWQGMDFGPLSLVGYIVPSYMLRRYAATHVGNTGMCEALGLLLDHIQPYRDDYTVVLMGHSFGARVLENADESVDPDSGCYNNPFRRHRDRLDKAMNAEKKLKAARSTAPKGASVPPVSAPPAPIPDRPPADLVFYINAAAPNTVTARTIKDWNRVCAADATEGNPVCTENPFYMSATSRTDVATGLVMFVANIAFSWWPTSLRPLHFELTPLSAANSIWMHTHHDPKNLNTKSCPATDISATCFYAPLATRGQQVFTDTYDMEPIEKDQRKRFWIMNVGHYLVPNHGDVWNPKIFAMLEAVIERNSQYKNTRTLNEFLNAR